jgi:hypothetical protein
MAIAAKVGLEIEKTDRKGVFLNALRLGEEAVYCELPDGFKTAFLDSYIHPH